MNDGRMDNGQPDETMPYSQCDMVMVAPTFAYDDLANVRNSRLEEAAHRLVTRLRAEIGCENSVFEDVLDLCDNVEDAIQLAHSAVLPTPKLLEVTGNVEEKELAARYMEQKEKAALSYAERSPRLAEQFRHAADMFRVVAGDFRNGLHLPEITFEGRVIPYNDTNDTGIRHQDAMRRFFQDVHARNVKAGWWSNIETGESKKRNVGELLILFVTEIAEGYLAWRDNEADDKLPQYPGLGVEMGDLGIRWADFCGAALAGRILAPEPKAWNPGDELFRKIVDLAMEYDAMRKTPQAVGNEETADFLPEMDIAEMIDDKLAFNAQRPDHKIENRLKEDGKRT